MRSGACAVARTLLSRLIAQHAIWLALTPSVTHANDAHTAPPVSTRPVGVDPPDAASAAARSASADVEIPPEPERAAPRLAVEVHTGFTLPLDNESLCPPGAGCVLEGGGGIGVSLERRWPSGFGALAAYDVWFLDSDSVFELATQQLLRAGMRYTMPTDYVFHPIFELSVGGMVLGDTFAIATGGFLVQAFSGVETELTETMGVRFGMGLRAFSHSAFHTERDDVARGNGVRFSESFFLEAGLTVM